MLLEQALPTLLLAKDMINLIKQAAIDKRKLLSKEIKEISITVATVGDSRTGKSEMAEKMEGVLNMSLPSN